MSDADHDDISMLAAEYVLGLLDVPERIAAENRLETDAEFVRAVARWQVHFSEMDLTAPQAQLPASLWPRLQGQLGVPRAATQRETASSSASARWKVLWHNLAFWRAAGLTAAMASLALAVGLGFAVREAQKTPALVAILVTDGNQPAAVVNAFADGRTELVPLEAFVVPEGKALEIWTLWDRSVGPRSVGLIGKSQSTRLRLDKLPLGKGQLFEITLEPSTGSPTGRPTGPILAKGLTTQAL